MTSTSKKQTVADIGSPFFFKLYKRQKVGLKLNIQKTKIMASGPITSWQTDGETVKDYFFGLQNHCRW